MGLNHQLLQRQFLLTPAPDVKTVVTGLAGLQAQVGVAPHFGLAARIAHFQPEALDTLRHQKRLVRAHLQRGTVHLLATDDFAAWAHLYQTKAESLCQRRGLILPTDWRQQMVEKMGDRLLRTRDIMEMLQEICHVVPSSYDAQARALMCGMGLVRVPGPSGESLGNQERWTSFEAFTARPLQPQSIETMITRYVSGFGPAQPTDFAAWSGLASHAKTFARLAQMGQLHRVYIEGKMMYDIDPVVIQGQGHGDKTYEVKPHAFDLLADFDNIILGHRDRTRIVADGFRQRMNYDLRTMCPILIGGMMAGLWQIKINQREASARLQLFVDVEPGLKRSIGEAAEARLATVGKMPARVSWV